MRSLIITALCVLAAVALPAAAGAGTVKFSDSWTDEPTFWFMGDFACSGKAAAVAGPGLESGSVRVTLTASPEGAHVVTDVTGTATLYEAVGGPDDVELGDYVGTWTYSGHNVEQWTPGGRAPLTGGSHGEIVFADGSTAMLKISFTLLLDREDGPQLFFATPVCGGE